jgi:hypothetical protein
VQFYREFSRDRCLFVGQSGNRRRRRAGWCNSRQGAGRRRHGRAPARSRGVPAQQAIAASSLSSPRAGALRIPPCDTTTRAMTKVVLSFAIQGGFDGTSSPIGGGLRQ